MWPIVMVLVAFPWLIVVVSVTRQFRCYTCIFEDHLEKQGLFRFKVIYYKDIYRWSVTSPSISESISLSSSGSDRTFYEGKLYLRAISSTGKWQKMALGTWHTDCGWIFAQLAYRMEYGDWVTGYF